MEGNSTLIDPDQYPNLTATSRMYVIIHNQMIRLHHSDDIIDGEKAEDLAERLLMYPDLPYILRARALLVLSTNHDDPAEAVSRAREAVRIIDQDVRAKALANGQEFGQSTLDEARRLLREALESLVEQHKEARTEEKVDVAMDVDQDDATPVAGRIVEPQQAEAMEIDDEKVESARSDVEGFHLHAAEVVQSLHGEQTESQVQGDTQAETPQEQQSQLENVQIEESEQQALPPHRRRRGMGTAPPLPTPPQSSDLSRMLSAEAQENAAGLRPARNRYIYPSGQVPSLASLRTPQQSSVLSQMSLDSIADPGQPGRGKDVSKEEEDSDEIR